MYGLRMNHIDGGSGLVRSQHAIYTLFVLHKDTYER